MWFEKGCVWRRSTRLAPGVGEVGIRRDPELGDDGIPLRVGVVHEEAAVPAVLGVKRETEEPPLAARADPPREVEEAPSEEDPVLHDPDPSSLLDDEEPLEVSRGRRDAQRSRETGDDEDRLDAGGGGRRRDEDAHGEERRARRRPGRGSCRDSGLSPGSGPTL